jgi:hypothetical protein
MNKSESYFKRVRWLSPFLLTALVVGCGGGQAPILGGPGIATGLPLVTAVVPAKDALSVPVNTKIITAAFSKAMNSATLTPASFTLACGTPAALVAGTTVSYAAAGNLATLTLPEADLPFDTACTATVTTVATDATGVAMASNFTWGFTTAPAIAVIPTVTTVAPIANAVVPVNTKSVIATFSQAMDSTTLTPASFTLACGPVGTPTLVAGTSVAYAANVATLTLPAADLPASATCNATVTTAIKDAIGTALAANYAWSFTTGAAPDTTLPRVTLTLPATTVPGPTLGVATNSAITATFTEAMVPASIFAPGSFTLTCAAPCVSPVNGSVSYAGNSNTVIFTPLNVLAADTTYTATVTKAATDLAGNPLAGNPALPAAANDYVWTFKTLAPPALDIIAPWVTVAKPANLATNVPVTQAVNATFSEAMKQTTMITANFTVKETLIPANSVGGTVAYDVINNIATFLPTANLKPDTDYTVTVTNAATDLAGNPLVTPPVAGVPSVPNPWTFRTAAAVVVQPPLAINLRSAASFGIASRAGLTTTGVTVVNGDVAIYPTPTCSDATGNAGASQTCLVKTYSSPTGMTVNGSIYWAGDPFDNGATALSVTNDLNTAWVAGKAMVPNKPTVAADDLASFTSVSPALPGIYHNATLALSAGQTATLDAQGDVNAVWVFQVDSSFVDSGTLLLPTQIILKNGAQARNIWFVVGLDLTIGSGTSWNGNILAGRTATINNGSTVIGRVLAGATGAGAITLTGAASPSKTTITVPN